MPVYLDDPNTILSAYDMHGEITRYNLNDLNDFTITSSPDALSTISLTGSKFDIATDTTIGTNLKDEIYNMLLERLSKAPIVQHKCHNCGATVEIDEDKHIFICRYCGSVYAIGTAQIYS